MCVDASALVCVDASNVLVRPFLSLFSATVHVHILLHTWAYTRALHTCAYTSIHRTHTCIHSCTLVDTHEHTDSRVLELGCHIQLGWHIHSSETDSGAVTNLFSVPCVSTDTREVRDACIHTTNYTNTPRCNRLELHLIGERVNGGVCQGHDALGPCRVQGLGFRFGLGSGGWGRRGCKTLFRLRRVQEFRLRRTPVVQGHVAQGHTRLILMRTRRWTHA